MNPPHFFSRRCGLFVFYYEKKSSTIKHWFHFADNLAVTVRPRALNLLNRSLHLILVINLCLVPVKSWLPVWLDILGSVACTETLPSTSNGMSALMTSQARELTLNHYLIILLRSIWIL